MLWLGCVDGEEMWGVHRQGGGESSVMQGSHGGVLAEFDRPWDGSTKEAAGVGEEMLPW